MPGVVNFPLEKRLQQKKDANAIHKYFNDSIHSTYQNAITSFISAGVSFIW